MVNRNNNKNKYTSYFTFQLSRLQQWYLLCMITILSFFFYFGLFANTENETSKLQLQSIHRKYGRQITVVINTFKRPQMLEDAIDYYSQCDLVKYIYIIWSEKQPPTESIIMKYEKFIEPKVIFSTQEIDSLNNRFKPLTQTYTDSIFTVDDDMRVNCKDLHTGYEVWQSSPSSLVGYMPRLHIRRSEDTLIYRCWWTVWWRGYYSIILTKAAFLHHKFFVSYTEDMPDSIKALVDKSRNCEDIAMQFHMTNSTQLPPIYVKGHLQDLGALNGISTNKNIITAGHMDQRSFCLNELVKIYGFNPLKYSHVIVDSADNGWTNVPSTWYEYISSDLWKFY